MKTRRQFIEQEAERHYNEKMRSYGPNCAYLQFSQLDFFGFIAWIEQVRDYSTLLLAR